MSRGSSKGGLDERKGRIEEKTGRLSSLNRKREKKREEERRTGVGVE